MIKRIEERVNLLIRERDQLIAQAERQVAAYNGAINELERLLKELADDKDNGLNRINGG